MKLNDALGAALYAARISHRIAGRPGREDRPPMPAGHPISWGAITDGTLLNGTGYPHPVFEGLSLTRWTHRD